MTSIVLSITQLHIEKVSVQSLRSCLNQSEKQLPTYGTRKAK